MADQETTFRLKFDNADMIKVFDQMIDRNEQITVGLKDLEKRFEAAFEEGAKAALKQKEALDKQAKSLDVNKVRFKSLTEGIVDGLKEAEKSSNDFIATIARIGRTAGPIGAVFAGLATVVTAAFFDVKKNANAVKVELEGLKAIGNELKDRVFAGIRGVGLIFSDPIASAKEFAKVLTGVNGSLSELNKQGQNLELLRQGLSGFSRKLIQIEAERVVQLQKIQALAGDENRTTAERINLLNAAAATENRLNSTRISQLSFQLDILQKQNEVYGEEPEILDEIATIEADLIELRGANQLIAIQTQQQVNALLREEAEARDRIIQQLRDFNALASGTTAENAILSQIKAFEELKEAVTAAGLADEFAGEVAELDRVIDGLTRRLTAPGGLIPTMEQLPTIGADAFQAVSGSAEGVADDFEEVADRLADSFGKKLKLSFEELTEDQNKFLQDQFGDIFESLSDIIVSNTVIAINQQQEVIDARENAITELEQQLAEEEDLAEKGVANNASRLRQSLQEERTILRREQQRRLDLEKRAARQRLITNSIQQASEITLATAKLLKEGASGFIPGLIAAAGGIALLFRIIAQSKANAAAFSQPPQFREGTSWLSGPNHEGGGIAIEAEGGERILSRKLNEMVGGREMTNEELVDFALKGMNADSAIGPLAAAVGAGAVARQVVQEVERMESHESLARTFRDEIGALRKEMREVIERRPTYYPTDQPGRREYWDGHTKVVEKIVPKGK